MKLLETLLELEIELNRSQSTREAFAKKLYDNCLSKNKTPSLTEVYREHSKQLKEKRLDHLFGTHIRQVHSSSDIKTSRSRLKTTRSASNKNRPVANHQYNPISQQFISLFDRIIQAQRPVSSRLPDKPTSSLVKQYHHINNTRLRRLRTSSDLKFKMKRKDALKADRLAKLINCIKNARPEMKSVKQDLDNLSLSSGYRGSAIRRLRSR